MARSDLQAVQALLHRLNSVELGEQSDRQLLERFVAQRDERAFAVLVSRHGSLVLNVCRRLLGHDHDAEDAFQATFLVLARKAASVTWQESVAGWLHEVACRVAAEARGKVALRRTRETLMETLPERSAATAEAERDLDGVLDEELRNLPEKYRVPLVLCCLEGRSREEAARQLGWTPGMVKGRLERGRQLLGKRLARRGIPTTAAIAVGLLATATLQATPSSILLERTVQLAGAFVSRAEGLAGGIALRLAEGVLRTMATARWSVLLAVGAMLTLIGTGVGLLGQQPSSLSPPPAPPTARPRHALAPRPTLVRTLRQEKAVRALAFTPDGKKVASAGFDGTFRLWDVATGKQLHAWSVEGLNSAIAIAPGGSLLAGGNSRGELFVWDIATGKEVAARLTRQRNIYALAFSPDSKLLASASHQGTVSLWDPRTGANHHNLLAHEGRCWSVAFSPDGKSLVSSGEDGAVRFWDPVTGKERKAIQAHTDYSVVVAFSPDGKRLASVGYDNLLTLREADTGKELRRLEVPGSPVVLFTPDGKRMLTADRADTIYVWDVATGKQLDRLKGHRERVLSLAISATGEQLASSSEDGTIHLWDLHPEQGS